MSEASHTDESAEPFEVRGTVKWFNTVKGFGFITPADEAHDAFLHLSVLRDAGHEELQPGATVVCEIVRRDKGLQVTRILDVDNSTAEPQSPITRDTDGPAFDAPFRRPATSSRRRSNGSIPTRGTGSSPSPGMSGMCSSIW